MSIKIMNTVTWLNLVGCKKERYVMLDDHET